MYNESVQANQS